MLDINMKLFYFDHYTETLVSSVQYNTVTSIICKESYFKVQCD